MSSERPKPPAWLSISGSPRASSGKAAARKKQRPQAPKTAAKTAATVRTARKAGSPARGGVQLSDNARVVLERRYLAKDARGRLAESPEELFRRVAHNVAEAEARFVAPAGAHARVAAVEAQLGYFVGNVARMQYGTFRKRGYFIGSGVIEAGCKTVIGARCKQSGMFWSLPGAERILAFRCIHASRRLSAFWKHRLNQHAARNDALSLAA